MYNEHCANCGDRLGRTTGTSSLYNPGGDIILCEPCWLDEDDLIEEKGTNNMPDLLNHYYDVMDRLG